MNYNIEDMLIELEASYFEVVLIPAPDPRHSGHMIRACQYANPKWYQEFCAMYVSCRGTGRKKMRRPRTIIKRADTIAALKRIQQGQTKGIMVERLLDFVATKTHFEDVPF